MIEETIKIPEPIMDPETNNVASRRLKERLLSLAISLLQRH
jgi:hypothetical protein